MTAPAEMPGLEKFGAAEPDMATDLATKIMALDWMDRRKWTCESQADRHGELQEMIDAAFAKILAEKEREIAASIESHDAWATIWNDKLEAAESRALAAEAALAEIARQDEVEIALDPDWPRRIASAALAQIAAPDAAMEAQ